MDKIRYAMFNKRTVGVDAVISELLKEKLLASIECGDLVIVGRWGTNKTTLKKLLEKHKQE